MTLAKPCARGGCTGVVTAAYRRLFDRKRYCSCRCSALARMGTDYTMPSMTDEQRRRGARKGGRQSGALRRREAMLRWASVLDVYLPSDIRESFSARQLAAVRALLVKVGRAASQGRILGASQREQGSDAR